MEGNQGWKEIVRKNRFLSEYDRELLEAVFEEIAQEQKDTLTRIEEEVKKELSPKGPKHWNIVTAIVDKEAVKQGMDSKFEEIVKIDSHQEHMDFGKLEKADGPGNMYCAGICFLNCRYQDIVNYTDREYHAKVTINDSQYQVPYRLYRSSIFFEEEEKVERAAAQYQVQVPPLYSPMSRRAVLVRVNFGTYEANGEGQVKIDFQYKDNGLDGIIMPGKTLVWNVSVTDKDHMPRPSEAANKKIRAQFDKEYNVYRFDTEENEYIYVESQETDIRRINGDIYLATKDRDAVEYLRYWRFCIHPYTQEEIDNMELSFTNKFNPDSVVKERIRTEGDVQHILSCFTGDNFRYIGCRAHLEDTRSVIIYDKMSSYHYPKNGHLRSSSFCYVRLEEADDIYFEDRVSYVMAYMNYFYPEFHWVGVV